jgi:hypothetical protein
LRCTKEFNLTEAFMGAELGEGRKFFKNLLSLPRAGRGAMASWA